MNLKFLGTYARAGEERKPFSFSREISDEVGVSYLTDREPGNGYRHYDEVKDFVVSYLIESGVLPKDFEAGVHNFASLLVAEGMGSLNFEIYAEGYDPISFPCLNNS